MSKTEETEVDESDIVELPARQKQIDQLTSIFGKPDHRTVPSLFIYGHSSTGKSVVLSHVIDKLQLPHALVNCVEFFADSLLFCEILQQLDQDGDSAVSKCDNMNDFARRLKQVYTKRKLTETMYLIFDKAERLRDRGVNLLPALVNLQELTSLNLCVVFMSELPWEKFCSGVGIRQPFTMFFPDYTKDELATVLCFLRRDVEADFYRHYISMVLAVFSLACRDLRELSHLADLNYKIYCQPIEKGLVSKDEKHKLWKNAEPHFKEALQQLYLRKVSSDEWQRKHENPEDEEANRASKSRSIIELPFYSKFLLIAAYIASYNPSTTDRRFFVKNAGRMRKTLKSMKKDERKNAHLRGPHAFPLDRMMAIFYSIVDDRVPPTAHLFTQITSLVSLHLLAQMGHEDQIDSPRYKCVVSLDVITNIAKTVSFDVLRYLYDFV